LEFIQDLTHGIPKDVNHPERAYVAEWVYSISFKLLVYNSSHANLIPSWCYSNCNILVTYSVVLELVHFVSGSKFLKDTQTSLEKRWLCSGAMLQLTVVSQKDTRILPLAIICTQEVGCEVGVHYLIVLNHFYKMAQHQLLVQSR
jgi:hypothetical protein